MIDPGPCVTNAVPVTAAGKTGGDVDINRAQAKGDIKLSTENRGDNLDPKA
jgi:hypothetical protein